MTKVRTWAGLDVHAAATVACVVDAQSGEMSVFPDPITVAWAAKLMNVPSGRPVV